MVYMASWAPGGDPGQRLALDPWPVALAKWDKNKDGRLSRAEIDDPEVLDRFARMDLDQSGDLDQAEWERHAAVFRRAQNALLALRPSGSRRTARARPIVEVARVASRTSPRRCWITASCGWSRMAAW